jgi:hypothetical protein
VHPPRSDPSCGLGPPEYVHARLTVRMTLGAQGCSLFRPNVSTPARERCHSRRASGITGDVPRRTSLVRALAPAGVGLLASHFEPPLRPGWPVLTGSVSRQLGSVACVRRAASPNEVQLLRVHRTRERAKFPQDRHRNVLVVNSPRRPSLRLPRLARQVRLTSFAHACTPTATSMRISLYH